MPPPPAKTAQVDAPGWHLERLVWRTGAGTVIGVDEAGRGALAGPVVAGAAILEPGREYPYRDSKQVPPQLRAELAGRLRQEALACAVGFASAQEIDEHGILAATHLAAGRALAALGFPLERSGLVTDFLKLAHPGPVHAAPRADAASVQVAAASILAKVARDEYMVELHEAEPQYGFAGHKGYGTAAHLRALDHHGPGREHRLAFAPVAARTRPAPDDPERHDASAGARGV